jgi:beta-galactosidase
MVKPTEDLSRYRAVIAPQLLVLPDAVARSLSDYVASGGVLLTCYRTGVKDETGLCHARTLPGLLAEALGITIEEYESTSQLYSVVGRDALQGDYTATAYADWISPGGAEVLAGYTQWHLKPFAAATRNHFKKGVAYYVGSVIQEPEFYDRLIAEVLRAAGVEPIVQPPEGVEVSVRESDRARLLFLLNHTEEQKVVEIPAGKRELLTGSETQDRLELGPYDVAVIKLR